MPAFFYFDLAISKSAGHDKVPGDVRTLLYCAESFGHTYGVIFILTTIWWAAPQSRRKLLGVVGLLVCCGFAIFLLKNGVMRLRPRLGTSAEFTSIWESFQGVSPMVTRFDFSMTMNSHLQSFPSGHAANAVTMAVGLSLIFPGARYCFLLLAGLAMAQRVAFNSHYLSDVGCGAACALLCVYCFLHSKTLCRVFFPTQTTNEEVTLENDERMTLRLVRDESLEESESEEIRRAA